MSAIGDHHVIWHDLEEERSHEEPTRALPEIVSFLLLSLTVVQAEQLKARRLLSNVVSCTIHVATKNKRDDFRYSVLLAAIHNTLLLNFQPICPLAYVCKMVRSLPSQFSRSVFLEFTIPRNMLYKLEKARGLHQPRK